MPKSLFIVLIVLFVNVICIAIYCRIQRKIDLKKFSRINNSADILEKETKNTFCKDCYHWINAYIYGWVRYNILLVGNIPSYRIRNILYRYIFAMQISRKTVIFAGCEFRSPWNIKIGRSIISANCILDGRGGIIIENDVVLGSGVHIWTEEHNVNDPYFRVLKNNIRAVVIKHHSWICSDSTILPGITVKEGAVLASRAVATKDCEEFSVYIGIPAKKNSDRNRNLLYKIEGKPSWHFM